MTLKNCIDFCLPLDFIIVFPKSLYTLVIWSVLVPQSVFFVGSNFRAIIVGWIAIYCMMLRLWCEVPWSYAHDPPTRTLTFHFLSQNTSWPFALFLFFWFLSGFSVFWGIYHDDSMIAGLLCFESTECTCMLCHLTSHSFLLFLLSSI